ncbi:hypothetical protein Bbelb_032730 [Branchiostoma belcheri]|nr:hypothetical protein Bbelb_032730 [Branchiostoma belcheri]
MPAASLVRDLVMATFSDLALAPRVSPQKNAEKHQVFQRFRVVSSSLFPGGEKQQVVEKFAGLTRESLPLRTVSQAAVSHGNQHKRVMPNLSSAEWVWTNSLRLQTSGPETTTAPGQRFEEFLTCYFNSRPSPWVEWNLLSAAGCRMAGYQNNALKTLQNAVSKFPPAPEPAQEATRL